MILPIINPDGIIIINEHAQARKQIESITKEMYYAKLDAVKENFDLAQQYIHPENLIIDYITNQSSD